MAMMTSLLVCDLLDLLTVYGQEFENAIVAEDGESAIMFIGITWNTLFVPKLVKISRVFGSSPKIEDLGLVGMK